MKSKKNDSNSGVKFGLNIILISVGLIPAMAIDATTKEPLMLAYMNKKSLLLTLELGEAVYYSRSRQEIWHKGATSGHVQKIREIRVIRV